MISSIEDFLVLEAQDYIGGRIKQVPFAGMKVEEGANTRFKTIMVKIYTRFQTKTAQKPYPLQCRLVYRVMYAVPIPTTFAEWSLKVYFSSITHVISNI